MTDERYPHHEFFIENQVIISGPEADLTRLLAGLNDVDPQPVRVLRFSELGERLTGLLDLAPDWAIALYRLVGDAPDVRKAIAQMSLALTGSRKGLQVEPNYVTGHPWDVEGAPWDVEGAPWDVEGSPWDVEGSPADSKVTPRAKKAPRMADPRWFMDQWALRAIDPDQSARPCGGSGVRVAVFDTSPYYPALAEGQQAERISNLAQDPCQMTLHVHHPPLRANPKPSSRPLPDLRNHGYFVAGLVHALAPGSDMYLVRVLDHHNRGDLFTLEEALFDFLKGLLDNPPAHGAVANFSLGIRIPPQEAGLDLPPEVRSLYALTRAARSLGVVLVAAAGNASKGQSGPAEPEIPACFETVIGVAASNQQHQRACFSNAGDLAAPGGDGRAENDPAVLGSVADGKVADDKAAAGECACRPRNADCLDGNSGAGLVGPVLLPSGPDPHYTFWSGSSFSAPLVSGLAALALEQVGPCMPEQIEAALRAGALPSDDPALGAGIIQVAATLEHCKPN